jgi:hypothetical protein
VGKKLGQKMKLNIFTIVLDGLPWIAFHAQVFNRLSVPWHWYVIEGAAANRHCTAWCKPQEGRLSGDGTTAYLDGLASHPCVTVIRRALWDGKIEMVNAPMSLIREPGVLMQIDSDELWTTPQLEKIFGLFGADSNLAAINFYCNYFIGPNIVTTDSRGDWLRGWRFFPGMKFIRHEPPTVSLTLGDTMHRDASKKHGLVFDHMSYALESQVAQKEKFYGYVGATEQWRKFQQHKKWPVHRLKEHLSFAGAGATADLFRK